MIDRVPGHSARARAPPEQRDANLAILEATQRQPPMTSKSQDTKPMSSIARGSFTVEIKPASEPGVVEGVSTGRMSLSKRFEGDLSGTGSGEMLTALTPIKGSAGYVAIERFSGTLAGKSGSFVFQHSGTMHAGAQQLSITVVPGSGTGELQGLAGSFKLNIVEARHLYEFEYSLPDQAGARSP